MGQRDINPGRYGENMAVGFLKESGYKILERNYRSPFGEIDIIAKDGDCLVFVEVKSRTSSLFGPPYLAITKRKKRSMIKTALSYIKRRGRVDTELRIDVVSIELNKSGEAIELIKNAFSAEG